MAKAKVDKPVNNGVNVEALFGAQEALKNAPEAAKFKWRATVKWIKGTHSRTTVENFYGLGAEQKHKTKYAFDADHPEIFAAEDNAATPVEIVLAGLASCLTAGVADTERNWTLRAWATAATPAVRQLARPARTISTGVAALSSAAKISGWSASNAYLVLCFCSAPRP